MRLTSKGRYAVTAMLDVALNSEAGPVPLADISERQGISLSYPETWTVSENTPQKCVFYPAGKPCYIEISGCRPLNPEFFHS